MAALCGCIVLLETQVWTDFYQANIRCANVSIYLLIAT